MTSEKDCSSILMIFHYPDLPSVCDWLWHKGNLLQPSRSTTSSDALSEYGISAVVSQMLFCWESSGGVTKCQVNCFLRLHWSGDGPAARFRPSAHDTGNQQAGLVVTVNYVFCSYGKSTVTNLQKRCKTWNCRGRAGKVEREGNA